MISSAENWINQETSRYTVIWKYWNCSQGWTSELKFCGWHWLLITLKADNLITWTVRKPSLSWLFLKKPMKAEVVWSKRLWIFIDVAFNVIKSQCQAQNFNSDTVIFSILSFGSHVKKFRWNFNQDFSFLSKSNLKSLFLSDTMYWL